MDNDYYNIVDSFSTQAGLFLYFSLEKFAKQGFEEIFRLPYCLRIVLESILRNQDKKGFSTNHAIEVAQWAPGKPKKQKAIPFIPGRILLQDYTGIPVLNDITGFRAALDRLGYNPQVINPVIPTDLVIDHSLQVDKFSCEEARIFNEKLEFERNLERFQFLRWCQNAYDNLRVVPPSSGIVHQINLEYFAKVVLYETMDSRQIAFPDTLLGTDSHSTMINGIGVLGWGVGGIEAMAAMLGFPIEFVLPEVIGLQLLGELPPTATPTDLTLSITSLLRNEGVVGKFIEVFGEGADSLSVEERAMIANMTPESGATMTFFPVDEKTLRYMQLTGRDRQHIQLVEEYCKRQGLFRTPQSDCPIYSDVIIFNLDTVEPVIAGPKRPQDLIKLSNLVNKFKKSLSTPLNSNGFNLNTEECKRTFSLQIQGKKHKVRNGAVVIAAITSCTNTSNPYILLGAGLMAKKAVEKGLKIKPYVKTSLAPGSRAVTAYLQKANLLPYLEELGFNSVGYGCTTCIGNSGPIEAQIDQLIREQNLIASAVLSGNRNFEGRVHRSIKANYLASPMLVVAFALAGKVNINFTEEAIGKDSNGKPVLLADIWPSPQEIKELINDVVLPEIYQHCYQEIFKQNETWNHLESTKSRLFQWKTESTYIQEPPFLDYASNCENISADIQNARILALFGDSITTDHISPAGQIAAESPAGKFLMGNGVNPADFNTYGSRRGNHNILVRGTFNNVRLHNVLTEVEGGYTIHFPSGKVMPIFDAALRYQETNTPLILLAGKNYGSGSSRDWAAKGPLLLGVRAVIAQSFERIHRSNLVLMGILPLEFMDNQNALSLGITGMDEINILNISDMKAPGETLEVIAKHPSGIDITFKTLARIDTELELSYFQQKGIFPAIMKSYSQ